MDSQSKGERPSFTMPDVNLFALPCPVNALRATQAVVAASPEVGVFKIQAETRDGKHIRGMAG